MCMCGAAVYVDGELFEGEGDPSKEEELRFKKAAKKCLFDLIPGIIYYSFVLLLVTLLSL